MPENAVALPTNTLLLDCWQAHARARPADEAIIVWTAGEEPFRWRWGPLIDAARHYALLLQQCGVSPGEVCALMLRHHRLFYPIYMGIEALGAVPAVLAYPNQRLHPDKFRHGLEGMAQRSGLDWLLTDRDLEPLVRPLASAQQSTIRQIVFPLEWPLNCKPACGGTAPEHPVTAAVTPDCPCLLQHSSGTTGLQKAVVLSHRAVLEHVARYSRAIGLAAGDRILSWLPLYHDMGLIASFHLPLAAGVPTIQMDPFEWVMAPVLMLEAVSCEKATLAWLPNFAYHLMADRVHDEDMQGIRLDSLRLLINCSEPVRHDAHEKFARRFAPFGFRRSKLAASYAMAETTFAVTQTTPGTEARRLEAARDDLAQGAFRPAAPGETVRVCVSSGKLISGCQARIVSPQGDEVPEGKVGEVLVRSVSLFEGYRGNPEKTAEALRDGWYVSGDLAFRWEGEYYIIGRQKDIIIVAGKNLYPEDIEDAVNEVAGILPGRVIAFGFEDSDSGTEQVCVVAETECDQEGGRKALRRAVIEAGMQIDVTVNRVHFVPPRWLIKSSAGKPSRSANRLRVLTELESSLRGPPHDQRTT